MSQSVAFSIDYTDSLDGWMISLSQRHHFL